MATDAIQVWAFELAPEELQMPYNGGDEDMVILVPPNVRIPYQLYDLGCCSNDIYEVAENGVVMVYGEDSSDSGERPKRATERTCPNYIGYTIIIPCHA